MEQTTSQHGNCRLAGTWADHSAGWMGGGNLDLNARCASVQVHAAALASMPPRPTNRLLGGACPLGRGLEGGDRQDVRVGGLGGGDRQQARGPLGGVRVVGKG
eukprot:scaffold89966_cov39-Phaeocystis_antarctica.AAC.2